MAGAAGETWKELIEKTREIYADSRKTLRLTDRLYRKAFMPLWMRVSYYDALMGLYLRSGLLYRKGRIVYGHIVQANTLLFAQGKQDHPANVVFSQDPYFDKDAAMLKDIAQDAYTLKGKQLAKSPELQKVGEMLANENKRFFNVLLPGSLAQGRQVYMTTVMIHRKHLPGRQLNSSLFPLLILPEKTKYSILLPSRYWTQGLKGQFTED